MVKAAGCDAMYSVFSYMHCVVHLWQMHSIVKVSGMMCMLGLCGMIKQ